MRATAGSPYTRRSWSQPRRRLEPGVIVDRERSVVGEAPPLVDRFLRRARGDARRGDVVVDAPAHVLRPGLAAVGPPGVLLGLRVQAPEYVHPAQLVEHAREPGALLGQEAGVLLVGAPVLEIDLAVRDVPVAAQQHFVSRAREFFQLGD